MRISVIGLGFLLFATAAHTQPQFSFSHLDINDGLSNNHVSCFLKDRKGYMWFGTVAGLNRYDGHTFRVFGHDYRDSSSVNDNHIVQLFEDHLGFIWVESRSGLNIYNPAVESFANNVAERMALLGIPAEGLKKSAPAANGDVWYLGSNGSAFRYSARTGLVEAAFPGDADLEGTVNDIAIGKEDALWMITGEGVLLKLDASRNLILKNNGLVHSQKETGAYRLFVDSDEDVWVYAPGAPVGAHFFDSETITWRRIQKDRGAPRLNSDLVNSVVEDNAGNIWLGTDHGGVNLIDKKDFSIQYLVHDDEDEKSIGQNSVNAMYKDDTGIIWIGLFKKGVSFFHEDMFKFRHYSRRINNPQSLPFNDVNCFEEDRHGNIWIGTNGGGLIYFNRKENSFTQYRHSPSNPHSLSADIIVSLHLDHRNTLWIGTYHGGLNAFDGNRFKRYRHDPSDPASLADDRVWEIVEDSDLNLWIGAFEGGLDLFDREREVFLHFKAGEEKSIHSNFISSIVEDKDRNLWIGAAYGIDVYDRKTGSFSHIVNTNNDPAGLSHNNVLCLYKDSRDWIWVGTREGLNLYDYASNTFRIFRKEDGLANNAVLTILEDDRGNLWLGAPSGLSNMIVSYDSAQGNAAFSFRNYDVSDGLQGREFNENAALKTSGGELLFGGANGFNIFSPNEIRENMMAPRIVFTDFQIYNHSIGVGEKVNGRVPLPRSISETEQVMLKHKENMFAVEFAALSFFHPGKILYRYKLEGFNDDWIQTDGKMRKAVFTNLDPGDYTFRLRASSNGRLWSESDMELKLTVLPPFWRSNLALICYIILVLSALALARKLILDRERNKHRLEAERKDARRRHTLDLMKIRFLTNISHEFRTPLSLIIAPVERLISQSKDDHLKQQYQTIGRNARRLLNLVNQLLDFRKLEVQELKLAPVQGDLVSFVRDLTVSFSDIAEKKRISFVFNSMTDSLIMSFDPDKMERIIFNLLSNAFKFTPENGSVSVEIEEREYEEHRGAWIEIRVKDDGIGIPSNKQNRIFERFFQDDLPEEFINQGSGIGLAITQAFVKLHGGKIKVESAVGEGSCFTIALPFAKGKSGEIPGSIPAARTEISPSGLRKNGKSVILLVEDNEDLRFYLKDNLNAYFTVLEASNGVKGLQATIEAHPDIVVSDIVMPGINGMELCRKIRSNETVSRTPVILLTAKSSEEQKVEGYEAGADEYITKPFNFEILLYKIRNLIERRKQENRFKFIGIQPNDVEASSMDEELIRKSVEIVEQRMADSGFSVEELSRELGMSRVNLYKKLLPLTGKSPIEFIRVVRIKRAAQLLEKTQLTISEVAYQVGFNNPKYFTKYFKQEYKVLPSQYGARQKSRINHDMS